MILTDYSIYSRDTSLINNNYNKILSLYLSRQESQVEFIGFQQTEQISEKELQTWLTETQRQTVITDDPPL